MIKCISFEKLAVKPDLSDHFSKTVICYKRKGYTIDVIKQTACLAVNPIKVDHFAYLFNCTPVDRGSDSMMARLKLFIRWSGPELFYVCFSAYRGSTGGIPVVLFENPGTSKCLKTLFLLNPHLCLIICDLLIARNDARVGLDVDLIVSFPQFTYLLFIADY